MKKVFIWVALGLMSLGIALFVSAGAAVDFDFARFDNMKYVTNSYAIHDKVNNIVLNTVTTEIEFKIAEDGICRVVCYEPEKAYHDVSVSDGVLAISWMDSRNWLDRITIFNFHTPTITVYLPKGSYQSLKVYNTTGDIKIEGEWIIGEVSLKTSTGDVYANGWSCDEDVSVHVTTGDVKLENVNCKNLTSEGSSGNTELSFVTASEVLRINQTTGDIKLHYCDGGELYLRATTGDISGILRSTKVISAHATTGDVDVPNYTSGGKCEINTTTGDICIKIP